MEALNFVNTKMAKMMAGDGEGATALLETKVMYLENHLYKLDTDIMDEVLGLSYDGIRNFERSKEVMKFLEGIKY